MSGYSKTPLVKKLGYKPGMKIRWIDVPSEYPSLLIGLPEVEKTITPPFDLVHVFCNTTADLEIVPSPVSVRNRTKRDDMGVLAQEVFSSPD